MSDQRRPTVRDLLGGEVPQIDPLLCDRSEKAALEARNAAEQIGYIEYLTTELRTTAIREMHVLEFQKLAVKDIYPCAGKYRTALHDVRLKHGKHRVPDAADVPRLVHEALERINSTEERGIDRAAFALWRLNWIHPFAGGNGRTARAITHLILCLENEAMLPGTPQIPTIIARRVDDYTNALQIADKAHSEGREDFSAMRDLVLEAAFEQLLSAVPQE